MRNPTPYELYLASGTLAREAYDLMLKIYRAMNPFFCGYSPSRQLLSQLRRVPKTPYLCKALPADVHLMMLDFISVVSRLEDNLRDESLWLNDHTVAKEGRTAWDEAYEQIGEIMHRKPRWL